MRKYVLIALAVLILFRLIGALVLPVTQDEAYYFIWSFFPDLGYFDHPPMIAWLSLLGRPFTSSWFMYRSGGVILALLILPISLSLFQLLGLRGKTGLLSAVILFNFNLFGAVFGFIATPDIPMMFAWSLALHEAAMAIKVDRRRWLTAGLATGIGLWGKYTIVIIGPVFLWALLCKRGGLKSIWPYLGALVCLLAITPHLWWNSQNDWISLKFQLGHGFSGSHAVDMQYGTPLEPALPALKGGDEERLAHYFLEAEVEEPRKIKSNFEKGLARISNFVGGQLGLWGFLLLPLGFAISERARKQKSRLQVSSKLDPELLPLIKAATWFPLLVFGLVATRQSVEANWPAVYILGASILLPAYLPLKPRLLVIGGALNILIVLLVVVGGYLPGEMKGLSGRRVLAETRGYKELAALVAKQQVPCFADRYQTVSQISFYQNAIAIGQWPGITRNSEFTRRAEMGAIATAGLNNEDTICLVTNNIVPSRLRGWRPVSLAEVRDCIDGEVKVEFAYAKQKYIPGCKKPVHRWFLTKYVRITES